LVVVELYSFEAACRIARETEFFECGGVGMSEVI